MDEVKPRFGNIKEKNLKNLFNMISDKAGISRAQLARDAGLSKPAVSALVDDLVSLGLVHMKGEGKSELVGRKPISIEVNSEYGVFVTVALNRTTAVCCIYDFSLEMTESFTLPVEYRQGALVRLMDEVYSASKSIIGKKIICNCFAIPAVCNYDLTEVRSTVLNIAPDFKFIDELRSLNLPGAKILANESVVYAYAEHRFKQKNEENLIYVEVSEGVGAGIVINDRVFRGVNGSAGEFGHISVDRNGEKCACGRRGCLELMISKSVVLKRAVYEGVICDESEGCAAVARAAETGNKKAICILDDVACNLAFALGNMIAMFDIENIVIGGGAEAYGSYFLGKVRSETDKLLIGGTYKTGMKHYISYACLGENAKNLGVAKYFCDNILPVTHEAAEELYFV